MVHQRLIARCALSLLSIIMPIELLAQNSSSESDAVSEERSVRSSDDWNIRHPQGLSPGAGMPNSGQFRGRLEQRERELVIGPDGTPRFIECPDSQLPELLSAANEWVYDSTFQVSGAPVYAMLWHKGKLYVGGNFTFADDIPVSNIAVWDPATNRWSHLGFGVSNTVRAIISYGDDIIVGGDFEKAGGLTVNSVARWDGTSWHALGDGVDDDVHSLALFQDNLIVGGEFTYAGDEYSPGIARWNRTSWRPLGGTVNGEVYALAATESDLYVGGYFQTIGSLQTNNVARWDGAGWSTIGSGLSSSVYALKVWNGDLYAGGDFFYDGNYSVVLNSVGMWDGSQWNPVGLGTNSQIFNFHATESELYAVGNFTAVHGSYAEGIARWDGNTWHQTEGVEGIVYAAASDRESLYIGGMLSRVQDEQGLHAARLKGTGSTRLGLEGLKNNSFETGVEAMAVIGDELYVGGFFSSAGGIPAGFIARWNMSTREWSRLGSGVNAPVLSFHVVDGKLYVGGTFTRAGEGAAYHIAVWDPATGEWERTGTLPNWVYAIESRNDTLYAGGYGVWRYVNNQWQRIGTADEFDGWVYSLGLHNNYLYAGGSLFLDRNYNAGGIVRLDGSRWELVGGGVVGSVQTIRDWNGGLYIGGNFDVANNPVISNFARLDGQDWESIGRVGGSVYTITPGSDGLYVGGFFTSVDSLDAFFVARWDGLQWYPLQDGLSWGPVASVVVDEDVYFGGYFLTYPEKVPGLAHWRGGPASVHVSSGMGQTPQLSLIPDREGESGTLVIDGAHTGGDRVGFYSLLGEQIFSTQLSDLVRTGEGRYRLDLSMLPTGPCFVLLRTGEGSRSVRLMVVR